METASIRAYGELVWKHLRIKRDTANEEWVIFVNESKETIGLIMSKNNSMGFLVKHIPPGDDSTFTKVTKAEYWSAGDTADFNVPLIALLRLELSQDGLDLNHREILEQIVQAYEKAYPENNSTGPESKTVNTPMFGSVEDAREWFGKKGRQS